MRRFVVLVWLAACGDPETPPDLSVEEQGPYSVGTARFTSDGRTLQSARLIENASMQLPGDKGKSGRRISAKGIDVTLGPDGSTVTNLVANQSVQVDLPPDGETPARRIRAASLLATGASTSSGETAAGIQAATFSGDVEFRETRAESSGTPQFCFRKLFRRRAEGGNWAGLDPLPISIQTPRRGAFNET